MKNATITISFEQEKLKALQFYAGKKDADMQGELDDFLQKLYEKYVPAQTREYIESQMEQAPTRQRRPRRPGAAALPARPEPGKQAPQDIGE